MTIACAVLAAGASRRLGFPKQLVSFDGEPLVRRTVKAALAAGLSATSVVVGAHAERVSAALAREPVSILHNPYWEEGMAASIRVAAGWARAHGFTGLLLTLCDQLALSAAHLERVVSAFELSQGCVASSYAAKRGVPALFPSSYYAALQGLSGDRGASALLVEASSLMEIPWPEGELDFDVLNESGSRA
jgi:CTP:molybdopterin cytidylyltransferase MocA